MKNLSAILFVGLLITGIPARGEDHIVECKTKNVWDAGFTLHFDLESYRFSQPPQIDAKVFRLVPLWRRVLAYSGVLQQSGPSEIVGCAFSLADNPEAPSVRLEFRVEDVGATIHLVMLDKEPQEKFSELECDPRLLDVLVSYCGLR